MRKLCSRRNVLLTLAAIVILPVVVNQIWSRTASFRGKHAAQRDLAHGHYVILAYGLPPAGVVEYAQIMRQKYGVEYRQVARCIVSQSLVSYADAYDEVSGSEIRKKFGQNFFANSWDEATKEFREKHKADLQNVSHSE